MDEQETTIYHAVLITGSTLGVILVFFLITLLRQQRLNRTLYREKIRAEIDTLEKERARMAADLHDDLGPSLLAIKFQISSFDFPDAEDMAVLQRTNTQLDQMMHRVRDISSGLLPNALVRKGLIVALREFLDSIPLTPGLQVQITSDDQVNLEPEKSIHLFRILQEITHNTLKHARATQLDIVIRTIGNELHISTQDNGIGFDPDLIITRDKGLGMHNITSRTEILSGKMYLAAAPMKGTKYLFVFPV